MKEAEREGLLFDLSPGARPPRLFLVELFEGDGADALEALQPGLAAAVETYLHLDRLRCQLQPLHDRYFAALLARPRNSLKAALAAADLVFFARAVTAPERERLIAAFPFLDGMAVESAEHFAEAMSLLIVEMSETRAHRPDDDSHEVASLLMSKEFASLCRIALARSIPPYTRIDAVGPRDDCFDTYVVLHGDCIPKTLLLRRYRRCPARGR